jgi:ubiquitin-protein ligase
MDSQTLLTAKRLKGEIRNLKKNRENYYQVVQDKKDSLLFYFLIKGDSDSPYKDGYYIGKI